MNDCGHDYKHVMPANKAGIEFYCYECGAVLSGNVWQFRLPTRKVEPKYRSIDRDLASVIQIQEAHKATLEGVLKDQKDLRRNIDNVSTTLVSFMAASRSNDRPAKEEPLTDREVTSILQMQTNLRKQCECLRDNMRGVLRQLQAQAELQDEMQKDVLLHKTIANRMLSAFMSPLGIEEDRDTDEDDERDDED